MGHKYTRLFSLGQNGNEQAEKLKGIHIYMKHVKFLLIQDDLHPM